MFQFTLVASKLPTFFIIAVVSKKPPIIVIISSLGPEIFIFNGSDQSLSKS